MRLRFSRTADYGLRAALEVARAPEGSLLTRRDIAVATDAPASVLAQSLAALVRAGLLAAQAGPGGGYRLAREPGEVTIHDVVMAIDSQEEEQQCVMRERECSWEALCPFHPHLATAQERYLETLRDTSLADVLESTQH